MRRFELDGNTARFTFPDSSMKSINSAPMFGLGKLGSWIPATLSCPVLARLGRRIAAFSGSACLFNTAAGNGRPTQPCEGPVGKPTHLLALELVDNGTSGRLTPFRTSGRITR